MKLSTLYFNVPGLKLIKVGGGEPWNTLATYDEWGKFFVRRKSASIPLPRKGARLFGRTERRLALEGMRRESCG